MENTYHFINLIFLITSKGPYAWAVLSSNKILLFFLLFINSYFFGDLGHYASLIYLLLYTNYILKNLTIMYYVFGILSSSSTRFDSISMNVVIKYRWHGLSSA